MSQHISAEIDDDRFARSEQTSELIDELRRQIDVTDAALLDALARRMTLVTQIGRLKQVAAIATVQPDRWRQLLEQRIELGRSLQLPDGFIVALFELIHHESIQLQNRLRQQLAEKVL
jgi:chorismate mutase